MNDAEYMKKIRTQLGHKQSQMARLLGYGNKKDISRIERGHRKMSSQVRAHLATIEKYMIKTDPKDSDNDNQNKRR